MEATQKVDPLLVEYDPEEETQNNQEPVKNPIVLREGNIAYDIERPLFEEDIAIDYPKLKEEFLRKLASQG